MLRPVVGNSLAFAVSTTAMAAYFQVSVASATLAEEPLNRDADDLVLGLRMHVRYACTLSVAS